MSTTSFALSILPDYTNATEATLATSLAGQSAGSAVIYNTDLSKTRIWDGSAFVDGPTSGSGAQGAQGAQGFQGSQGFQGITGTGAQGAQGFQGASASGSNIYLVAYGGYI